MFSGYLKVTARQQPDNGFTDLFYTKIADQCFFKKQLKSFEYISNLFYIRLTKNELLCLKSDNLNQAM